MASVGGPKLVDKFLAVEYGARKSIELTLEQRRASGMMRSAWWGLPARNTLDPATALLPKLLCERLDEIGIDLAVLYPIYGLTCTGLEDEELRLGAAMSPRWKPPSWRPPPTATLSAPKEWARAAPSPHPLPSKTPSSTPSPSSASPTSTCPAPPRKCGRPYATPRIDHHQQTRGA